MTDINLVVSGSTIVDLSNGYNYYNYAAVWKTIKTKILVGGCGLVGVLGAQRCECRHNTHVRCFINNSCYVLFIVILTHFVQAITV